MSSGSTEIDLHLPKRLKWQHKLAEAVCGPARFVVAVMGRRAGKTTALADLAGEWALDRKALVFWGAPTYDTAHIGKDKFLEFYRPACTRIRQVPSDIDMLGGGQVLFRSFDRPGAALGRGIDLAVIDEAARVKRQVVYEDLLPTIGDTGGKIVAITTPRGRHSWVFDWYTKAKGGDPLYAVVHGPSTANPAPEVREFCEIAEANMPEILYRQEILGEFVEGEGAVFRGVRTLATLPGYREKPKDGSSYVIGIDVAKHQDYTVCYAMDLHTGEVHGMDRYRQVDWPAVKSRISTFWQRWGCGPIWLDATGVGDPIYDDLAAHGLPVTPFKFSSESKSGLVVALMNAMEKGEIRYPDDDVLCGELESFSYEELPSGKFRYSAPEGMHDDCVMALALANWGRAHASTGTLEWL